MLKQLPNRVAPAGVSRPRTPFESFHIKEVAEGWMYSLMYSTFFSVLASTTVPYGLLQICG